MSTQITYTVTRKQVHNARICNEIEQLITAEVFDSMSPSLLSQREPVVEWIDMLLNEEYSGEYHSGHPEITQISVVCDTRNNTPENLQNGKYNLDVMYTQWNCLTQTSIRYVVNTNSDTNSDNSSQPDPYDDINH